MNGFGNINRCCSWAGLLWGWASGWRACASLSTWQRPARWSWGASWVHLSRLNYQVFLLTVFSPGDDMLWPSGCCYSWCCFWRGEHWSHKFLSVIFFAKINIVNSLLISLQRWRMDGSMTLAWLAYPQWFFWLGFTSVQNHQGRLTINQWHVVSNLWLKLSLMNFPGGWYKLEE